MRDKFAAPIIWRFFFTDFFSFGLPCLLTQDASVRQKYYWRIISKMHLFGAYCPLTQEWHINLALPYWAETEIRWIEGDIKYKEETNIYRQYPKQIPTEYVYKVPGILSSRPNWGPHPLTRKRVLFPLGFEGGSHTRLRVRGWGTQFGRLARNPGALYTVYCRYVDRYLPDPFYFSFYTIFKGTVQRDGSGRK